MRESSSGLSGYELFDFKVFNGSQSICTNIQNFASNARQFLENFVCLEQAWRTSDAFRYRTLKEWHKRVDEIENLCRSEMFNKHKPWALSALMKVDDEVEAIFEEIKADLRAKTGITGEFKIHGYKTQHNGTTYFIRCSAAGEFVHAEVYVVHNLHFKHYKCRFSHCHCRHTMTALHTPSLHISSLSFSASPLTNLLL
jgi:hypothetical protein